MTPIKAVDVSDNVRIVLDELNRLRRVNAELLQALKTIRKTLHDEIYDTTPALDAIIAKAEEDCHV
jgi:hypothetical protein